MSKLSIIIPAYNEEKTLAIILAKILDADSGENIEKEIIIVDDGSTDRTEQVFQSFSNAHPSSNMIFYKQPYNQGKGAALRAGIKLATGKWTIIQDADLEYDPKDYKPLLEWIMSNDAKVVYGSRFLRPENKHSYMSFYLGGRLVSITANILYGLNLTDEPTCYKMFDTEFLKSINLKCKGFEFCPEVTAKAAKLGQKIHEIPISYYPRSIAEGKKINWKDGVIAIWTLIKYRFVN